MRGESVRVRRLASLAYVGGWRARRLPARLLHPAGRRLPGRLGSRGDGAVAADPTRSKPPSRPVVGGIPPVHGLNAE